MSTRDRYITRGEYDDGRFFLSVVDSPEEVFELFDELDLQGGGYTWAAVMRSLAALADPPIEGDLDIDAEADNAYASASDRAVLDALEAIVRRAMEDLELLRRAIDEADPDVLE